jgi:energy-converting hydrogenase Eha subunit G
MVIIYYRYLPIVKGFQGCALAGPGAAALLFTRKRQRVESLTIEELKSLGGWDGHGRVCPNVVAAIVKSRNRGGRLDPTAHGFRPA